VYVHKLSAYYMRITYYIVNSVYNLYSLDGPAHVFVGDEELSQVTIQAAALRQQRSGSSAQVAALWQQWPGSNVHLVFLGLIAWQTQVGNHGNLTQK
jgi:hypothetical protein